MLLFGVDLEKDIAFSCSGSEVRYTKVVIYSARSAYAMHYQAFAPSLNSASLRKPFNY